MNGILYFTVNGRIQGSDIGDTLDKLLDILKDQGIINSRIEVIDELSGNSVSSSISIGHEEERP